MQTFTLTVLAVYARNPAAATADISHRLGVPPHMIRRARQFLGSRGYLHKDKNLNWHLTDNGKAEMEKFDREKAADDARFIRKATDTICTALGVQEYEISNFFLMDKGMTNDSYIFYCRGKKYIYRRAGQGSDMLVDRYREYANYIALQGRGISDVVVYHNPMDGTKITEFIENSKGIDPQNPDHMSRALDALRHLHNSGIKPPHDFDFVKTIDYYEEICRNSEAEFLSGYPSRKARVLRLLEKVDKLEIEKKFCHIDFVPGNCLLDSRGKVVLIDWEYSGGQDPLVDVAMFCISAAFDKRQSDRLLKDYLQKRPDIQQRARFYTYIATASLMWSLWSEFKTANGEVFEGYTKRTYAMCQKYCALAERMFDTLEQEGSEK